MFDNSTAEPPAQHTPNTHRVPQGCATAGTQSRVGILYLEHAKIHTHDKCVVATTVKYTVRIPAATLTTIFLGPGTSITHAAASIAGDDAVTITSVGSGVVRAYSTAVPRMNRP